VQKKRRSDHSNAVFHLHESDWIGSEEIHACAYYADFEIQISAKEVEIFLIHAGSKEQRLFSVRST